MTIQDDKRPSDKSGQMDDAPPFLKKWSSIYWFVIGILFTLIGLFYLFTISFQ